MDREKRPLPVGPPSGRLSQPGLVIAGPFQSWNTNPKRFFFRLTQNLTSHAVHLIPKRADHSSDNEDERIEVDVKMVPWITLGEMITRFEVILFDSDGVLVRRPSAVPGAPEAIARLNSLEKPYFVLTNDASALPETRSALYTGLGLAIDASKIITSGLLLKDYFRSLNLVESTCVVLGTEDSACYVREAGGEVVSFENDFDVLVVGDQEGFPFLEATGKVLSSLFRRIDRGETPYMVVPNPDLIYPEGDGYNFASGAISQMFESAIALRYQGRFDLKFTRLGKPHSAMFEEVIRRCGTRDMVMIGDTPGTDIRGANQVGITSLLVETGVATADLSILPESDTPKYRMQSLTL